MQSTLNTEMLAGMLKNKRGSKGLRALADEIGGVSYATLSRVEQGKIPDVETFIKICRWMEVSTEIFITEHNFASSTSAKDQVLAHLRAERELRPETVDMLIHVIHLAYEKK